MLVYLRIKFNNSSLGTKMPCNLEEYLKYGEQKPIYHKYLYIDCFATEKLINLLVNHPNYVCSSCTGKDDKGLNFNVRLENMSFKKHISFFFRELQEKEVIDLLSGDVLPISPEPDFF